MEEGRVYDVMAILLCLLIILMKIIFANFTMHTVTIWVKKVQFLEIYWYLVFALKMLQMIRINNFQLIQLLLFSK